MSNANSENKETKENKEEKTFREAAMAGQFYPDDKDKLEKMIDGFMSNAIEVESRSKFLPILILPHAGYEFSGGVAAEGFKQVQNKDYNRIIILGRSHQNYFSGISADTNDFWRTPLGNLEVDRAWIKQIDEKYDFINQDEFVHRHEHSLEVMAPFIKKAFNDKIKIIPLLLGDENLDFEKAAQALLENMDNKTLLIISSDLSHYPEYQKARDTDQKTIGAILTGNLEKFQVKIKELKIFEAGKNNIDTLACAEPAIAIAEKLAEKLEVEPFLLKYANSGDIYPETRYRVVGYAAIGFYSDKELAPLDSAEKVDNFSRELNQAEQKRALEIARKSIDYHFINSVYNPQAKEKIFKEKMGVFVTLRKNGKLRGCIGNFQPNDDLINNIKEMALAAAFDDSRFTPLQSDELENIKIEISVLSPMQKIDNPETIEIGKHGVYIIKGMNSGVFLPQVATEEGWSREEFLDNLCENKAGIDKNAWRDGSAYLYIFTAQVFGEK